MLFIKDISPAVIVKNDLKYRPTGKPVCLWTMMMPASLVMPMVAIHNHTHTGKSTDGRTSMAEQMTKTRSAILSILEPSSLVAFIFLANVPSIISENPHQQ